MKIVFVTPVMIFTFGLYFLFKLRFFFLLHPVSVGRRIAASLKEKNNFKAFALALAGTLGVGNIVGVAYGLTVGGAGSVFWMLLSALFSSVIKYCESALGGLCGRDGSCGMMGAISQAFKRHGKTLAMIYAFLLLLLSFSMGTALQGGAVVGAAKYVLGAPSAAVSLFFSLILLVVIIGGVKKIEKFTAAVVPMATIVYIFICAVILIKNSAALPSVLLNIWHSAFNFRSGAGGISAFLVSKAVKEGFARGLLSNEAGAGTSAMAEGRSTARASDVGLFGMCEVFFDTVVLCTLTALAVLVSVPNISEFSSGMELVFYTVRAELSSFSGVVLFFLIFAFALSTAVCWYYYGSSAASYLFKREIGIWFAVPFAFASFIGSLVIERYVIGFVDIVLLLLSIITLITLLKSSERIFDLSEREGLVRPHILNKSDSRKKTNS